MKKYYLLIIFFISIFLFLLFKINLNDYTSKINKIDTNDNTDSKDAVVYNYEINKDVQEGIIYLTFDDGPSEYTTKILDILDKYGIKATFFVTGNGNDNIIKEEYDMGNTIGLHTYTHNWNIYTSIDSYFADLNAVLERVVRITGDSNIFAIRFAGGSSNTVSKKYCKGIMSALADEVTKRGFIYYDWNVSIEDAGKCSRNNINNKEECVLNNFKSQISKDKINVILMHDTKLYTANALDSMIQYALDNGYTFKQITKDSPKIHQTINN